MRFLLIDTERAVSAMPAASTRCTVDATFLRTSRVATSRGGTFDPERSGTPAAVSIMCRMR